MAGRERGRVLAERHRPRVPWPGTDARTDDRSRTSAAAKGTEQRHAEAFQPTANTRATDDGLGHDNTRSATGDSPDAAAGAADRDNAVHVSRNP